MSLDKKTVLIYRNELLPYSETFIRDQALSLTDWRPLLVGRRLLEQLSLADLDVRLVGPASENLRDRISWRIAKLIGFIPIDIIDMLRAEQPSLVHAHFGIDAIDAWPLARSLGLPLLITLHGYDVNIRRTWWEAGNAGFRMRRYPRRLLGLAHAPNVTFIAVSKALKERAVEFGIPSDKIKIHYIGINTKTFRPGPSPIASRPLQILFVGRLVEKKGCRYLIQAMTTVKNTFPDASLVIIGDGPLRKVLEEQSQKANVGASFLGVQPATEIKRQLDKSRLLCLPSITAQNGDAESFGLVLLEAQSSGVPVVTSALGGSTEGIQNGVTGIAFEEKNSDELARVLTYLLSDERKLSSMAAAAVPYVTNNFDVSRCTNSLQDLYDDCLG